MSPAAYIVAAIVLLGAGLYIANRPHLVTTGVEVSSDYQAAGFSHAVFEALLQKYVDAEGNVNYGAWHASSRDRITLDAYLATIESFSPDTHPERFEHRSDALAYWMYAYNAWVIRSVLEHWPLDSVTEVRAPVEAVRGFGFFYQQRFLFGGEALSLYAVEHDKVLQGFRDPRVHFVLNCASESCPPMRPELPTGEALEALLVSATQDFLADPRNVAVDHDGRRVILSTIFKWYRRDFINDLRRRNLPTERGVIDYLAVEGDTALRAGLSRASDYEVTFADYDWAINKREY